jgi:predicted NUDIX family NTP pyrophosphohydrolase
VLFRRRGGGIQVLLAHPGGPFWKRKDEGVWSIPKGLIDADLPLRFSSTRILSPAF